METKIGANWTRKANKILLSDADVVYYVLGWPQTKSVVYGSSSQTVKLYAHVIIRLPNWPDKNTYRCIFEKRLTTKSTK